MIEAVACPGQFLQRSERRDTTLLITSTTSTQAWPVLSILENLNARQAVLAPLNQQ